MTGEKKLQLGDIIGGFKLEKELGRGSMGVVFKAHELSLNRKIALKVLASRLSANEEIIQRFRREAQIIAALRHPNIINVLSYGEDRGFHYFAMEYVAGRDLEQILIEKELIPFHEALAIVRQVANALAEAGAKGVVHRDIKPSNIMVNKMGEAFVTDFGVAHFAKASERLTQTGLFIGTPMYASPEQATGRTLDVRSDIYSLGAVLYRMLSGRTPVSGESPLAVVAKITSEPVAPISQINPLVPKPICKLIQKMMAKELKARYQSPKDLLIDVDHCANAITSKGKTFPLTENIIKAKDAKTTPTKSRSSFINILGGILGVALSVLFVVWLVEGRGLNNRHLDNSNIGIKAEHESTSVEKQSYQNSLGLKGAAVENHATKRPGSGKNIPAPEPGTKQLEQNTLDLKRAAPDKNAIKKPGAKKDAKITALPGEDLTAKVDKPPLLPNIPTVLVMALGDEFMRPTAHAQLHSLIRDTSIKTISFAQIPLPQKKMLYGETSITWYQIKQLVPNNEANFLLLGEAKKTGSMPIRYYGQSQELTTAFFSLQVIDMDTGTVIHTSVSDAIHFTLLNMNEKLHEAVAETTVGIEEIIQQYWEKNR
jgi:serine/threonine protein kinase